jgi:hypothetical protein
VKKTEVKGVSLPSSFLYFQIWSGLLIQVQRRSGDQKFVSVIAERLIEDVVQPERIRKRAAEIEDSSGQKLGI